MRQFKPARESKQNSSYSDFPVPTSHASQDHINIFLYLSRIIFSGKSNASIKCNHEVIMNYNSKKEIQYIMMFLDIIFPKTEYMLLPPIHKRVHLPTFPKNKNKNPISISVRIKRHNVLKVTITPTPLTCHH